MGFSYHKTELDDFIKINGKSWTDYHPDVLASLISSLPNGESEFIVSSIKQKIVDNYEKMTGIPLPDNYAEHAGRPSIKEVGYMSSENDGYPFLPGHSPMCDGREYHYGMCKCKYDEWNHPNGIVDSMHTEMWPGGPCIDDFDM